MSFSEKIQKQKYIEEMEKASGATFSMSCDSCNAIYPEETYNLLDKNGSYDNSLFMKLRHEYKKKASNAGWVLYWVAVRCEELGGSDLFLCEQNREGNPGVICPECKKSNQLWHAIKSYMERVGILKSGPPRGGYF